MTKVESFYHEDMAGVQLKMNSKDTLAGPCPKCGGEDRFHIWTNKEQFLCNGCGLKGDASGYLVRIRGLSFSQAFKIVNTETSSSCRAILDNKDSNISFEKWQKAAEDSLELYQMALGGKFGKKYLDERYLDVKVALYAGIGFNPNTVWPLRSNWGLAENGERKQFVFPSGLVLSIRRGGKIVGLEVRCYPPHKYMGKEFTHWQITGSNPVCYWICEDRPIVCLFESILDAVLACDASRGKLCCIATTGAKKTIDQETVDLIKSKEYVFACPDNDESGRKSIVEWRNLFPNLKVAPCVGGKDLRDMHTAYLQGKEALSVKQWYEYFFGSINN